MPIEQGHFLEAGRRALGEILIGLKKVDQKTLDSALEEQKKLNLKLGDVLVQKGILTKKELDYALALQQTSDPKAPILARKKLGDLLLETGKLTPAQLSAALQQQQVSQKKIGEVLIEMGFVTQRDLDSAVKLQDSLAFSSRNAVLQRLQAVDGPQGVRPPASHATGNLDGAFAHRGQFLEQIVPKAFESAFGRAPEAEEVALFRQKADFVFGSPGTLRDPLPPGFGPAARNQAVDKLDTYFQNVIADRVTQLVGGDVVHKRYDSQGHVDVVGLGQVDLQIAIELATQPGFSLQQAQKEFLDKSPRAQFKSAVGRDFESEAEEAFFDRELEGANAAGARAFLRALKDATDTAFKPYHISRNDSALRAKLVLSEDELRQALALFRERHMDHFFEALVSSQFFLEKLQAADAAEAGHADEMAKIKVKQILQKLMQLLQQLMGSVPPQLAGKIAALVEKAQSGELSAGDLDDLVKTITDMFEKILQMFQQAKLQAGPEDIAQALSAMLDALLGGGDMKEAESKVTEMIEKIQGGANARGGITLEDAIAFVNGLNFNYNGIVNFGADGQNPMVKGLMAGTQNPQSLSAAFMTAARTGKAPIPEDRAIAFVAHLNETFRGVRVVPSADDPNVQKLIKRELLPGELAKQYRGLYQAATTVQQPGAASTAQHLGAASTAQHLGAASTAQHLGAALTAQHLGAASTAQHLGAAMAAAPVAAAPSTPAAFARDGR